MKWCTPLAQRVRLSGWAENPSCGCRDIADNRTIRVVFFKENLSTGWDCPRAETMMSFRHAQDATYIAQLLGRMIRTPLQRHIDVDETLNEVRLFLPHFNRDNVEIVMKALRDEEGSEIQPMWRAKPMAVTSARPGAIVRVRNTRRRGRFPWKTGSRRRGCQRSCLYHTIIRRHISAARQWWQRHSARSCSYEY